MVLPIGFFAPLPLAIMIPFMAAQSFAMGHAFGTSFQYGKRKISSMSNEEFNAITAVEIADNLQTDVRAMIPSMNQSFIAMENFQIQILDSMVRTFLKAVEKFFQFIGPSGGVGGVNPYVGTPGPNPTQDFFDNLFDPNFNEQDLKNLGKQASLAQISTQPDVPTTGQIGPDINSRWNFMSYTYEQLRRFLLAVNGKAIFDTFTPNEKKLFAVALKAKKPSGVSPSTAIEASGAVGIVQQIATMTAQLKSLLARLRESLDSFKRPTNVKVMDQFLALAKKYNQLVTQNRNPNTGKTYATLQIDTAKSMNGRPPRFIYKT